MSIIAQQLRKGYWVMDSLRGSPVARHLADLEQLFSSPQLMESVSSNRLQRLLVHATSTTEFYAPYHGCSELSAFPVIRKAQVREHNYDLLSSACQHNKLLVRKTSGSYGTPLKFLITQDKKDRQTAEIIFFNRWGGHEIGEKFAYVKVHNKKTFWTRLLQNEISMDPCYLTSTWLAEQRRLLHRHKPGFIIGYPSALLAIAEYCEASGDLPEAFRLSCIISISETLDMSKREYLSKVFGCPVLSRYATMEFGVLAHECMQERTHHLNTASYVFELLSLGSDEPARPGEIGRVVVTDLYSLAMPIIRYETGDLAVRSEQMCPCGQNSPILERLEGRDLDSIFTPFGERILPLRLGVGIRQAAGQLRQYQFVQTGASSYCLRICSPPDSDAEYALKRHFRQLLGGGASIEITYVNEIPALPSGKRPVIINEWLRQSSVN